ncbi:hypothetical protein KI372_01430 [Halobacterium salinarum]|nr:hypothetical protein [Halobacterium salinarum]
MPSGKSRRRVLAGAGSVILGGSVAAFGTDAITVNGNATGSTQLGADDLTAGTIPASADTLAVAQINRGEPPEPVRAVAGSVAEALPFASVPARLRRLMSTGSSQAVDASRIGKLAFIGSAGGRGAVVVWANWTEEHFADFVGVDSSTDRQAEMRHGRPMYTTGETAGSVLAETAFVVGHPSIVADTIGVWHGDTDPIGESTLRTYSLTRRQSPFRFSLGDIQLPCNSVRPVRKPPVYDHVTRRYGAISDDGELRVSMTLDSQVPTTTLAAALRRDLGLAGAAAARVDLPSDAVSALSVHEEADAVAVQFSPADRPRHGTLTDLFCSLSQLVTEE